MAPNSRSAGKIMKERLPKNREMIAVNKDQFQLLIEILIKMDYKIAAPMVRDGAIVYDEIDSINQLPIGMTDEQGGGVYRLKNRDDDAFFGFVVGPHSWKKYLFPPSSHIWQAKKNGNGFQVVAENIESAKMAFVGVRACELNAITIQDKIFSQGEYKDLEYQARRQGNFILAVNCTQAGGTCFCASMKTGPRVTSGFDLALTEIINGREHYFLFESGTGLGAEVLAQIASRPASEEEKALMEQAISRASTQMGRTLDTNGIKELLYKNSEHPRWDDLASRCLTCGNCTMVCPTCFCSQMEDYTDLKGEVAERKRRWDSCFTLEHSYIHGGSVRSSAKARYRQWLTHKLASWVDQFGVSGCVGCGRCITWCPVGIDLTEEIRAIRGSNSAF